MEGGIVYGLVFALDPAKHDMSNLNAEMFTDYGISQVITLEEYVQTTTVTGLKPGITTLNVHRS